MITSMQDYIVAKQRYDKLRPWEEIINLKGGAVVGTSSERDELGSCLQALIDDLVVEHGYSGARKIVNRVLDQVIQEHRHG